MSDQIVQPPADGTRPCARCGRRFLSHIRTTKYCTMVCRKKAEQARRPQQKQSESPKEWS